MEPPPPPSRVSPPPPSPPDDDVGVPPEGLGDVVFKCGWEWEGMLVTVELPVREILAGLRVALEDEGVVKEGERETASSLATGE